MNVCSESASADFIFSITGKYSPPPNTSALCHHAPRCHFSDLLKNVHVLAAAFCKSRHCTQSPALLHLPALAVAASA